MANSNPPQEITPTKTDPSQVTASFPDEIVLEIFARLPAKSVGRLTCLSKKWNAQLCSKYFINSHLNARQILGEKIVFSNTGAVEIITLQKNPARRVGRPEILSLESWMLIVTGYSWSDLVGSCNGLILVKGGMMWSTCSRLQVLNPVTRKYVEIPLPCKDFLDQVERKELLGLGYDSSSDDYKVVRASEYKNKDEKGKRYFFEVYSLRTHVWRRVDNAKGPFDEQDFGSDSVVSFMPFVNGALHWAVRKTDDSEYYVHAFDLATETFREIIFPRLHKKVDTNKLTHLMVLKGCLSISEFCFVGNMVHCYLWMMKEYGVVDSCVWFAFNPVAFGRPVHFVGEEELLCIMEDRNNWVSVDMTHMRKEGTYTTRPVIAEGQISVSTNGCTVFVESLVFPEVGNA